MRFAGPDRVASAHAVVLLLTMATACSSRVASRTVHSDARPCRRPDVTAELRCATIRVPESWEKPAGRSIDLNIVVVPARSPTPRRDPIVILQGGPGQGATTLTSFYARTFGDAREDRDILLVDQRGTGSSHPLACELGGSPADPGGYFREMFPVDAIRACRRALERTADVTQYTTLAAVRDLEHVRASLGYDRLNLYGTSYGTRVALVYLRAYPDRVRSMVLKGIVPMDVVIGVPFAADTERAIELLLQDCAAAPECRAAFPDLRGDLRRAVASLDRGAATAVLTDTATARSVTVPITRGLFGATVRSILQATSSSAELPLIIHRAAAGDWNPFARIALLLRQSAAGGLQTGMMLSVACSEDAPLISRADAERMARNTTLGHYWVDQLLEACAEWPRGRVPAGYRDPVRSTVATLLISGHLDPATPPQAGDSVARHLTNSRHIVVRYGSHSFAGLAGCVDRLMSAFVIAAEAKGLDASCVDAIRRPAFITR